MQGRVVREVAGIKEDTLELNFTHDAISVAGEKKEVACAPVTHVGGSCKYYIEN